MFATIVFEQVMILEKRDTTIVCELRGRTLEIPREVLWDEGDDLEAGKREDLAVGRHWAKANGLAP
jgi:hypothetical protein